MLAIDLFCGLGGWTEGFLAQGFRVIGMDLKHFPEYRGEFVMRDILDLRAEDLREADFIVASSPCEQFSVHGMPHFHPNPKYPELGIKLFEHTRDICEQSGKPYVMENVRAAQKFVGRAVNHCGPFYLWGNAVPAVFAPEAFSANKGIDVGSSRAVKAMSLDERREYRKQFKWNQTWSTSKQRGLDTASAAKIPLSISSFVAESAKRLVEIAVS